MAENKADGVVFITQSDMDSFERDVSGDILEDGLRRGLKGRHFLMIALGSIIGPGCYYGLGYTLALAGPLGTLLGFGILGIFVWALMQSVGEITTLFPVAGGFVEIAATHVDPALSFAMAWLYYIMWSVFLGADWNTATLVLQYWVSTETVPLWAWALIFWAFFSVLTTLGVGVYGEAEYIFGMLKFLSLAILFFISILVNVGAFGKGYVGFRYWKAPTGPIIHGINGFGQVFVIAAAYYVGTEIVSLAAGESRNPRRDVPRGVNSVVWRILFVFIGMAFFQGLICPSDSDQLLSVTSVTATSPFTIGFELGGWKSGGQLVNAFTLMAFISAGNGVVYVQSRTLYSMSLKGRAPKFFSKTSARGVPYRAILVSNLFGFLSLMNLKVTAGQVFSYFTSVGGTAAYIAWAAIVLTHIRIRLAAKKQGISIDTFPFKAFGHIYLYYFVLFFFIFLLLIQGFTAFEHPFNWRLFIASYITIPSFFVLFFGFKWYNKTHWVRLDEIDFSSRRIWEAENEVKDNRSWKRKITDVIIN